jgi:hypothetical protein
MGTLFFPPLKVNIKKFKFNLKEVKRVYFQFFFDSKDGNKRFRLLAYAFGEKRQRNGHIKPILLEVDESVNPDDYLFPKNEKATELFLGHLELSNLQIKKLIDEASGDYLQFTPRDLQINPFCMVYDVTNGNTLTTTETANPCPPARPPADDDGNT